jgi:hypothetical protein
LDERKLARMQWLQDPNQSNADNLNTVKLDASRYFRKKGGNVGEVNKLEGNIRKKNIETCVGHQ